MSRSRGGAGFRYRSGISTAPRLPQRRATAAHFFSLAEAEIADAVVTAEAVNLLPGSDGIARLMELARRYAGLLEPVGGYGIEFRVSEDGADVSVWLTLGRPGPWTGWLLPD